jgi:hypothetical protein
MYHEVPKTQPDTGRPRRAEVYRPRIALETREPRLEVPAPVVPLLRPASAGLTDRLAA